VVIPKGASFDQNITPINNAAPSYDFSRSVNYVCIYGTATRTQPSGESYTIYFIETIFSNGKKTVVSRRYTDFFKLDQQLQKEYIGLPKLPPKTIGDKLAESVVQWRKTTLQQYLRFLIHHPSIARNQLLIKFLTHSSDPSADITSLSNAQLGKQTDVLQTNTVSDINETRDSTSGVLSELQTTNDPREPQRQETPSVIEEVKETKKIKSSKPKETKKHKKSKKSHKKSSPVETLPKPTEVVESGAQEIQCHNNEQLSESTCEFTDACQANGLQERME